MTKHTLVYSPQCPNCVRFLDALSRTSVSGEVSVVDVHQLSADAVARLVAVPALLVNGTTPLYGTKAFEWLKDYEGDAELDPFPTGHSGLAFSDLGSVQGYASYADAFSAFEPVE